MTGNQLIRERFISSPRLIAPTSCCVDFNQKAIEFRQSINASVASPRLQADIAVKALPTASGMARETYEDTDGKKREFTGDSRPGVEKNEYGFRWEPDASWDSSKKLVITPSYEDLNSISTASNTGWVEAETPKFDSFEEMIAAIKKKPHIQLSKYKVDPKTDDIIPGSQKIIDPFAITSGLTFEERRRNLNKRREENGVKILPGRSLASRIPGGTLIARAAAAFGVLRDEKNKFRCPPGTPAANQFTDRFGSNCFGFSVSKFARFAAREAARAESEGKMEGLRNNAKSFFDFLYNDKWGQIEADSEPARIMRSPWWDAMTGDRFKPPDWRIVDVPENLRVFKNGNIRAQDDLARQDASTAAFYSALGIDLDDNERAFKALDMLRQISVDTDGERGWDLKIIDATRRGDVDSARLNPEEVERYITARLESIPGWTELSRDEQNLMVESDVKRYYESENAFMEAMIDQFIQNPSAMRFIGKLEYDFFSKDEAGSGVYGGRGQPLRGVIHFNPEAILTNQESMLPNMRPDERLAINAIGATSDIEAKMAVSDFLVNSTYAARHMAGLVDGTRSFTRHIALHEISHAIQEQAFIQAIQQQIDEKGFIEVPVVDKNKEIIGFRKVGDIRSLTGSDIMRIMSDVADEINMDSLSDALSRIEVVSNLAGSYPTEYKKGGEIWALEASAELWALRAQGIIYGEDVDAALEWMDKIVDGRSAADRAIIDAEMREISSDSVFDMPPDIDSPELPEEELAEALEDVSLRSTERRRETIKNFKEEFEKLDEATMFDTAAIIALSREKASSRVDELLEAKRIIDSSTGDEYEPIELSIGVDPEHIDFEIREAQADFDMFEIMYDESRKIWRKKYGLGARGESKRFDDTVEKIRRDTGLLEKRESDKIARLAELDDLASRASGMSEKDLIRAVADKEIYIKTLEPGSKKMIEASEELDILREQYIKNRKNAGDTRTSAKIRKDLASEVEALVSPKPKKTKKFSSSAEARNHAKKERARLSRDISEDQAEALISLGDTDTSDIAAMMNPQTQAIIGRSINRRNARLKRLGLRIDPRSPQEASLDQQVENILIPAMEAIDNSSIIDPFEMEAVISVDTGVLTGKTIGQEIDIEGFISGRVMRTGMKPADIPKGGVRDSATGKRKHKIKIQMREGDRGVFPEVEEGDQKFVIPPGKLRITGRDKDGTMLAEVSYQKDVVETVDSLAKTLEFSEGEEDFIWRVGANRKVQSVVDRYVADRRAAGEIGVGPRSDYDSSIADTSREILDSVIDTGATFGEPPLDSSDKRPQGWLPYNEWLKQREQREWDRLDDLGTGDWDDNLSPDERRWRMDRLSSGRDVFGPVTTREERTKTRQKKVSSNIREVRMALGGRGSREFPNMTRDSIDPGVAKLINELPDEELMQIMEDTAYRLHSGFDRRVRVRMRDEDIDSLAEIGKVRSPLASSSTEDGMTRRVRRLSGMSPQRREERLSSGLIDSPTALAERRRKEEEIADKAVSVFNKIISGGQNIDEMTDDDVLRTFGGKVKRSTQKSVSAKNQNLYEVEEVETALAMMMLGHHVTVKEQDIRLTEQAQEAFEKKIKEEAKNHIKDNHPKWIQFKESYAQNNPDKDITSDDVTKAMEKEYIGNYQADLCALYDPTKNLMCSGHIGIDREKMPQTNGRTSGHKTLAIRMLKDGKAAGKWEPVKTPTRNIDLEEKYKEQIDKELAKKNAKREKEGKAPLGDEEKPSILYGIIADKHSIKNESDKRVSEHRDSYESLTDEEKEWMYSNTNWQDTEVNLEGPFIDFLNEIVSPSDPENGPAVRRMSGVPSDYAPSQQQLVASKVDSTAKQMEDAAVRVSVELEERGLEVGTPEYREAFLEEMNKEWFMQPILTTKDKYILDGHHRWGGVVVANRSLPEHLQIPLNANEVQADIVEGLTLGKVFQNTWGIKEARLGAELDWEQGDVLPISDEDIDATSRNLTTSAPQLVDDIYESGDFIQIGSVGLSNNPDYAAAVAQRRDRAVSRRPSRLARQREDELNQAVIDAQISRSNPTENPRSSVGRLANLRKPRIPNTMDVAESERLSSGKTVNGANDSFVREYLSRTGLGYSVEDEQMPVFGYLVHKSHMNEKRAKIKSGESGSLLPDAIFEIGDNDEIGDGLTALGDIEIVLKSGVSNRTAYGRGNSVSSGHRPVLLNSRNRNDVFDSMVNTYGKNSKNSDMDAMMNLLASSIDGDLAKVNASRDKNGKMPRTNAPASKNPREPFQAQILGGFDIDEVEQINYPFSRISEDSASVKIDDIVNEKSIAEKLRAAGFSPEEIAYFYSIGGGEGMNTQSMQMLRNYRQSQNVKKSFSEKGFPNVKIAHPNGLDIENPLTHSRSASPRSSVEDVLNQKIMIEIQEQAEKMLKEIRRYSTPTVVSRGGSRL